MPSRDKGLRACEKAREYVSALLDREDPPELTPLEARHLVICPGCRRFQETVPALTRHLRLSVLQPVPDLTESILGRLPRPTAIQRHSRTPLAARWAAVAVPIGLALSGLSSGSFARPRLQPTHPVTRCTAGLTEQQSAWYGTGNISRAVLGAVRPAKRH